MNNMEREEQNFDAVALVKKRGTYYRTWSLRGTVYTKISILRT